ncbi:TRAP transporter large permease [Ramlibacter alkalitolerans]|uniref:TRAP transporter large permease protein n=1 Tax=Ramlibacter alkalitolerans TaxID=2039631 RepID=A0ABS1JK08_9BURK|nr:TRAP transporter large permease subunit [Ramlibacter alkalitolerans]MBL0424552.1 TRAP transporter large permease subunit [Ramlibacter alkalitolerans]
MDYLVDHLAILMFVALAGMLFSGFPVAMVIGGISLLFGLIGAAFGVFAPTEFFNFLPRMWGGAAENLVLIAAPLFIFMGVLLEKSGVAADLLRCLQLLLRRVPGGLALGVALMGTIMAATTGIIGASIVMLCMLSLPVMLQQGYDKGLATGVIAASGTLGILIPPSIMLVIMGDLMQISTGKLFLGAMLPGLMLAGLYLVYIVTVCWFKPKLAPPMPADDMSISTGRLVMMLVKGFVPPTVLIGLVLGSIFFGWATPTEAAAVGALGATVLALAYGRLSWRLVNESVRSSTLTIGMVFLVILAATCFSYVFRSLGGDDVIHDFLNASGLGPWGLLSLLMFAVFLLGFFFDWLEIILIVLPIFAPVVTTLDFSAHVADKQEVLYWFAVLVAVNLQSSFLTPPFGFALFFIKGTAPPAVRMGHIYKGIVPFVGLQVVGILLVMAFPEIVLWLPRLLLDK